VAKQSQVGFDAIGVCPEDANHLVADFGSIDGGEYRRTAQKIGYFIRARLAAQVGDHRVSVEDGHPAVPCLRSSAAASADRSSARAVSAAGPGAA
jgi:hypothetical protein